MQRPIHAIVPRSQANGPKDGRRYGVEIDPGFCSAIRKQKEANEGAAEKGASGENRKGIEGGKGSP